MVFPRSLLSLLLLTVACTCVRAQDSNLACGADGTVNFIPDGLVVEDIGKRYVPSRFVPDYGQFQNSNTGGTTSVRRNSPATLKWKTQGYYQRNRELGQVFNVPEGERIQIDAVVLRTGNSSSAILEGAAGAPVYIQFYRVDGTPTINDNGTPQGTESEHGFSTNHRTDDYLNGITYVPLAIARGGIFPNLPATTQNGGQPGHLRYLRWDLQGDAEVILPAGRYAFTVGFVENGDLYGFSLGNDNLAADSASPALRTDANGQTWWSMRREGDGTLPPTQVPNDTPPRDSALNAALLAESLYVEDHECSLSPTTDGFPDVDTYRTLEFYLETVNSCPAAGTACDDGDRSTEDDRTDGDCGCRGFLPGGCRPDGQLTYERFDNISGRLIGDLNDAPNFPSNPDTTAAVTTFESPTDVGDNYGARVYGYLCPPETGAYTFFVAGDDNVELLLSIDSVAANATRIAYHEDFTAPLEWDKFPTQQSAPFFLQAGTSYYVEARMKEASGRDHLAVGWQLPGGAMERPIPGSSISTVTGDFSTSTQSLALGGTLGLHPNPALGDVTIELDYPGSSARGQLSVWSLTGNSVYRQSLPIVSGRNRLRMERPVGIARGLYLLRLETPEGIWVSRLGWVN